MVIINFDDAVHNNATWLSNFAGYTGNPPSNEAEYNALSCWKDSTIAPTWADIQSKITNVKTDKLRVERNKKLTETDYWGSPDLPDMTQAQLNYRQALRDVTNTYTSLDDVVWPTKP